MGPTRMVLHKPVIAAVEGYAVAGGIELAHGLAALPQRCPRSDLRSSKEQWDLPFETAIRNETDLGLETILSGETIVGAARFATGEGRHGTPT